MACFLAARAPGPARRVSASDAGAWGARRRRWWRQARDARGRAGVCVCVSVQAFSVGPSLAAFRPPAAAARRPGLQAAPASQGVQVRAGPAGMSAAARSAERPAAAKRRHARSRHKAAAALARVPRRTSACRSI